MKCLSTPLQREDISQTNTGISWVIDELHLIYSLKEVLEIDVGRQFTLMQYTNKLELRQD